MNYSSTIALCLGDCRSSTEPGCMLDLQASAVLENVCWPSDNHMKQRGKKKQYKTSKQRRFHFEGGNNIFGFVFFSLLTWIQNKEAEERICAKCQEWNVGHKHRRICSQYGWHFYLVLEGFLSFRIIRLSPSDFLSYSTRSCDLFPQQILEVQNLFTFINACKIWTWTANLQLSVK